MRWLKLSLPQPPSLQALGVSQALATLALARRVRGWW